MERLHRFGVCCAVVMLCGLTSISQAGAQLPPGDAPPPQEKTKGREPAPMPRTGRNDSFSYEASAQYPGSYVVRPLDGSSPIIVSDSFLSMQTRGGTVQEGQGVLQRIRSYPAMVQQTYDQFFSDAFPDQAVQTTAITPSFFSVQDGRSVTVTQDQAAAPYARVSIRNADGSVQELSMAKELVQSVLANEQLPPAEKLAALRQSPFVLPEELRRQFARLSPEQWRQAISKIPDVARQEFVRMDKVYQEQKRMGLMSPSPAEAAATTASAAPAHTVTSVEEPGITEPAPPRFEPSQPPTPGSARVTREPQSHSFLETLLLLLAGAVTGGLSCYLLLRNKSLSSALRR